MYNYKKEKIREFLLKEGFKQDAEYLTSFTKNYYRNTFAIDLEYEQFESIFEGQYCDLTIPNIQINIAVLNLKESLQLNN